MFSRDLKARRRIEELSEELAKLQRSFKELELDWSNTFDKLKQMMMRVAKRAETVENATRVAEQEPPVEISAPGAAPMFSTLTPRQKQIQQQVLRRRAAGG